MDFTLILNPPISVKGRFALKWKFNLRMFWIITLFLAGLLLGFYILQLNDMAKTSFLIEEYEKEISLLSQKNKMLEIYFAKVNSLENRERLIKNLGFEPVDKIHYIRIIETDIAARPSVSW